MFKRVRWIAVGVIIGIMLSGGIVYAATNTKTIEAWYNNIKIVIDGQEIQPVDANGNTVEPFISNGTTYLPVRAVASALGKEVYWDGPNFTVYLGSMDGQLEYPSLYIEDAVNIGDTWKSADSANLTDNHGNRYTNGFSFWRTWSTTFETMLNMKYTRFKAIVYVPEGANSGKDNSFTIEADGKIIYSSEVITKTSSPITLDINITGCDHFKIKVAEQHGQMFYFGNAGFYQ